MISNPLKTFNRTNFVSVNTEKPLMRLLPISRISILTIAVFSFFSCTKKIEEYKTASINEYYPLAVGKYITYRLDSTVFSNFGLNTDVNSYQVKHLIESQITDNLGRPSYRVFLYLRDTAGTQDWRQAGSYFITPLSDQVEVIEDNLRFIKMHLPVKEKFSWKGNAYLIYEPYSSIYSFTNDNDMDLWDYQYENIHDVFTYKQQTLSDVVEIVHVDERLGLDTVDVINNKAAIPLNSPGVWLRGNATDTIIITALNPTLGHEKLTIYNQTNFYASLNKINIPSGLALYYEFANGKWNYPNPLTVANNNVTIPRNAFISYIFGTATDSIKIDVSAVDTFQTKALTICNRSNFDAYLNKIKLSPGFGRKYELIGGQWKSNVLFDKDPYKSDFAYGSSNYSVEKYAKNIGLVYKELTMWDYQPNTGAKTGFGIRLRMIDHN
jgi:hypothetical protein